MAPYFSVLPVPAGGLPTNAALLAREHGGWTVRVLAGAVEIPSEKSYLAGFGGGGDTVITSKSAWPAGGSLVLEATMDGTTTQHIFRAAAGPLATPPSCAWKGPIEPEKRDRPPGPESWPTNMPYYPHQNRRTFKLPAIRSAVDYPVRVRLFLDDKQLYTYEGTLAPTDEPTLELPPPGGNEDFGKKAKIVGVELIDLAGNAARYGQVK